MNPLVSVIIPAWNAEKLIKETIESALNQTYPNIEIIVIDDGSTDDTANVIKSIKDPRITYHYQENTGLPACGRNKGAKLAKGQYLAFLDSDDLWLPQKIEKQMVIMEENLKIGLIATNAWCLRLYEKTNIPLFTKKIKTGYLTSSIFFPQHIICNSTVIIRRNVYESIGGCNEASDLRASEDHDLFIRIFMEHDCYFLNEYLAYYRTGLPSISGDFGKMLERDLRHYHKYFDTYGLSKKIIKSRFSYLTMQLAFHQLHIGKKEWRKTLRKSIYAYPEPYDIIRYCFSFLPFKIASYLFKLKNA